MAPSLQARLSSVFGECFCVCQNLKWMKLMRKKEREGGEGGEGRGGERVWKGRGERLQSSEHSSKTFLLII